MPGPGGKKKPDITDWGDCNIHHDIRSSCRHAHERKALGGIWKHGRVSYDLANLDFRKLLQV